MSTYDDASGQTTLNIPSLVAFAVISFLAIRYFFFSPASTPSLGAPGTVGGARGRVSPDKIEQVVLMFPQLSRRDIEWELFRNGGSVEATAEKVLRSGRLETPPPNFQAQPQPQPAVPTTSSGGSIQRGRGAGQQAQKPQHTDLITRYNLSSRIGAASTVQETHDSSTPVSGRGTPTGLAQAQKGGWSQNKNERQDLLRLRREEMVLAARRKMEERDKLAATGGQ